jgi:hypothetical protein
MIQKEEILIEYFVKSGNFFLILIISSYFLKKNAVSYVFHSKIVQVNWHLKYRWNLRKAL